MSSAEVSEWPVSRADSICIWNGRGQWPDGSACALLGPSTPHGQSPGRRRAMPVVSGRPGSRQRATGHLGSFLHCVVVASQRPVSVFNMDNF